MYILVTYDVDTTSKEGARRLRCVAKACMDYGQRVQNSVFECEMTEAQYCLLKERIKNIIDMSLDSIRFYILSKNESKRGEVIGIETSIVIPSPKSPIVAPYAGAWIETRSNKRDRHSHSSHSM